MNSLLDNQKVRKRKPRKFDSRNDFKPISSRHDKYERKAFRGTKEAFRPRGIISLFETNSRLIDGITQTPAKFHNKRTKKTEKPADRRNGLELESWYAKPEKPVYGKRRFSFPVIPIAILLLALGLSFVVSWQGVFDWIKFDWISRDVISSEKDPGSQQKLAHYVGLGQSDNDVDNKLGNPPDGAADEIPLDLMETFAWQSYKVARGDSVSKIASGFSVSMDAIIASNGITNARSLREGEVLRIPNMDGIPYTVKSGDSLSKISTSMGVPIEAILDANDIQSDIINAGTVLFIPGARMNRDDLRLALGELFIYPLKGSRLSSPFGWRDDPISGERRYHAALDLSAPQGTIVRAAMEGRITALSYDRTYGNFIIISHPGSYQTMYAHLSSFSAKIGDQVAQGAQIGAVGSTGYSTGPHLHFAVFKNSRAVNPLDYLNPQR